MASEPNINGCQQQSQQTDDAEERQAKLEHLNQSTLDDIEKIVKDNPAGSDLWPFFRKTILNYKIARAEIVEKPKPVIEAQEPAAEPKFNFARVPADGDISILWPLTPDIARLLCEPPVPQETKTVNEVMISRSALSEVLRRGEILYQYHTRGVVRVAPDIVVKITKAKDTAEMASLHHIRSKSQTISVPAPLGKIAIAHFCYEFISFLPGIPLDRIWGDLATRQKQDVREQLNRLLVELRDLPLPSSEGYLGAGNPPVCKDDRRWSKTSTFISNEAQFNAFLLSEPRSSQSFINYLEANLPSDHRIVMTHGDLHPRNILVESEHTVRIVGIVDWEYGGGYPEYWEYVQALRSSFIARDDDWHAFLPERGIGRYFDEYTRDCTLSRFVS